MATRACGRPVDDARPFARLATAAHRATDRAGEEDVAALAARLDQIDAWIDDGLLNGTELSAADFQIAPNIALLLRFDDLAPFIEHRPAARLARRLVPDESARIAPALPAAWLQPLSAPLLAQVPGQRHHHGG